MTAATPLAIDELTTCGGVLPAGLDLVAGTLIDRWVVDSRVGGGGFGAVYKCSATDGGPPVAIKVLRAELSADDRLLTRFERETQALERLRHDNVVAVLDAGELHDGRPYLVMEWLDGRDLGAELRERGPLTPIEALAVMEDAGAAVAAAHQRGIIHRDIKPSNLMAVPSGEWFRVELLDFGVAKLLEPIDGAMTCTVTGQRLGTPTTMSPEQIRGRPVDARADIYGLGCLLHVLITGAQPFSAGSSSEVERMHLTCPRPRASDRVAVSESIDAVITKAMAIDPADRFAGVDELLAALRRASGGPVETTRESSLRIAVSASGDLDDEMIDAMDELFDVARDACETHGLRCALDSGSVLVAIGPGAEIARQAIAATLPAELAFDLEMTVEH